MSCFVAPVSTVGSTQDGSVMATSLVSLAGIVSHPREFRMSGGAKIRGPRCASIVTTVMERATSVEAFIFACRTLIAGVHLNERCYRARLRGAALSTLLQCVRWVLLQSKPQVYELWF